MIGHGDSETRSKPRIDLNCDLGEGAGHDAKLMPWITSANIACGAHAGNLTTMQETVKCAQHYNVAIGAHPGFADREHFGRRELALSATEVRELVHSQIRTLCALTPLRHVKPHGALYNLAARDRTVADAIVSGICDVDASLALYGLAGSELVRAGEARGLRVVHEVFADRTYQRDGSLTSRTQSNAMHETIEAALNQVLNIVRNGSVVATDGTRISLRADTICVHGDGAHAVEFAQRLNGALSEAGIVLAAPN